MQYQSYKGRSIDYRKPVMIYKNLHNGLFSVKQGGLVVAHIESVLLSSVSFKVNEGGRERVIKEKKKNVHAFIVGHILNVNSTPVSLLRRAITYNPYKYGYFYFKDDNSKAILNSNNLVYCDSKNGLHLL